MDKNQVVTGETNGTSADITIPVPTVATTAADVVPINCEVALAAYSEEEQREIRSLADSIDVTKLDNVMHYGAAVLKNTFVQCGEFLKSKRGTSADQEVIAQVIELSKKASDSYEDFNLVLQEPNFLQKIFFKLARSAGEKRTKKLQNAATTNYNLLVELKNSCDSWLDVLKEAMGEIENSAMQDYDTINVLEKYLIAGKLAEERIQNELKAIQTQHENTGLQQYARSYDELKEGYETFLLTMANLEKSRVMYYLSIGQLGLIRRANRSTQISIHTQVSNSLALFGQQLRNAVLDATNKEVLEGRKIMVKLNDEMIRHVSQSVGLTADEAERGLYAGFYNMEVAKEAVTTVIKACDDVKKVAAEMLPKMQADLSEINTLIQELQPHVDASIETLGIEENTSSTRGVGLKF